jgi:ABC-2 type transport system permease protein
MSLLRTAAAFVRKDFLEETSYRMRLLLGGLGVLLGLFFLSLMSEFVGPLVEERLDRYGGSYFAFVVLGIGLYSFLGAALRQLSNKIREAQLLGTLEALLATRTDVWTLVVCMPLFSFLQTSFRVLAYIALGTLFFDMPLRWGNWPAALLVLALTIAAFACIGLVVAGLTATFKRIEPVLSLVTGLALFLGGVYYPLSVLPEWLQKVAMLLPITPAIEGLRAVLLGGHGLRDIGRELTALVLFTVVMLPLGATVFRWGLRRAMRDGTLTQY